MYIGADGQTFLDDTARQLMQGSENNGKQSEDSTHADAILPVSHQHAGLKITKK